VFTYRVTLFRLFGFPVRVDLSWVIIFLLLTWTLALGYFPARYEGLAQPAYWLMAGLGVLGLFVAIILHEFAHAKVAQSRGLPMKGITLFIFGGVAEMTEEPPDPGTELRVAVAGPVVSIAIAAVSFGLERVSISQQWPIVVTGILHYMWWINGVLVVFNLVPAFPLDGGRVLRSILWRAGGSLKKATRRASGIGAAFGLALVFLGVISFVTGNVIGGVWWFVIGMFLRTAAKMSYQQLLTRRALEGEKVGRFMHEDPITVSPDLSVRELIEDHFYRTYHKMYPVVENGRLVGCVTTDMIRDISPERWEDTVIRDFAVGCSDENTIGVDSDAVKALAKMKRNDSSRLLVVERGQLRGIVTLKDLLHFLSLRIELEED
jgi:Zn-dependent protease/predicted transcriptional regulator